MVTPEIPTVAVIASLATTALLALLILLTKDWHGKHSLDDIDGVQRNHEDPTPRIGGIAIFTGLLVGCWLAPVTVQSLLGPMLLASIPAFSFGVAEDLTKAVGVRERLLATMFSGLLAWALTSVSIDRVDLPGIDSLLSYLPLSILFTAVAVSGLANAVNLIDGFNGIASGTFLIAIATLGLLAQMEGDTVIVQMCLILAAVTLGFFLLNFPFGKIFLGDGGAYLLGFLLAWVAVMLVARNHELSPWAALLACGYPILETVISVARRLISQTGLGSPDRLHLHSLIGEYLKQRQSTPWSVARFHTVIAALIWLFALVPAALALLFSHATLTLMAGFVLAALLYILVCLFVRLQNKGVKVFHCVNIMGINFASGRGPISAK